MIRFCALIAVLACALLTAPAQAAPIFSLSASEDLSSLSPGDEFTVSVNLAGLDRTSLPDFLGAEVLFEGGLLTVTSNPQPGSIIPADSTGSFFGGADGSVGFAAGSYDEFGSPVLGDGAFFSFGLKAESTGSGQFQFNPDVFATFVLGADDLELGAPLDFSIAQTDVTPVPEPSSLALFGLGAAGLAFYRRKRRCTSAWSDTSV